MTAPRRIKAGQRRPYDTESLLTVAVSVFNTRGYDGTTMEHLSAAAGIGKSSIYDHVTGKEDLLQRALHRALTALSGILDGIDPMDSSSYGYAAIPPSNALRCNAAGSSMLVWSTWWRGP